MADKSVLERITALQLLKSMSEGMLVQPLKSTTAPSLNLIFWSWLKSVSRIVTELHWLKSKFAG